MEIQKEENQKKDAPLGEILETGSYEMYAPSNGDIKIETLVLRAGNGARRVWKLAEISEKEAKFDIIKFA